MLFSNIAGGEIAVLQENTENFTLLQQPCDYSGALESTTYAEAKCCDKIKKV